MDLALSIKLEALIRNAESWDGELWFPPSAPDGTKVDLCALIKAANSSISIDIYVFDSTKYFGETSLNDLRRDLLMSAKNGGFDLSTTYSNSGKRATSTGVKRKLVLACTRSSCYKGQKNVVEGNDELLSQDILKHGTVVSKKKMYNNMQSSMPEVSVRKTSTSRPVEDVFLCPFNVIVELRDDNIWYLCKARRHSAKAMVCCQHKWHPKLNPNEVGNLSTRYITYEQRQELNKYNQCHLSTSVSANLLTEVSDFRWLRSQVRYCSKKEQELLNDLTLNVSSADQLLAYLRSRDDVSFVVLTDTTDGLLVTNVKGRQRREFSTTITSGSVFDR